jgi:hypothetical protein
LVIGSFEVFGVEFITGIASSLFQSLAKEKAAICITASLSGEPAGIQTPNLLIRSQTLYSVKLQARSQKNVCKFRIINCAAKDGFGHST